jgi:hypothetical protein
VRAEGFGLEFLGKIGARGVDLVHGVPPDKSMAK